MSFLRYAAPALAVVSLASAQCSVSGTTTVGAEATGLSSCPTFSGSIAIASDAPGTVDFGMLGSIDGDLIADTAVNVATLTGNSIANITGQFKMNNMSALFTLNMQGLRGVGQGSRGGIMWNGLPLLQTLNIGQGLESAAAINIQNTQIQDVSALNVQQAAMITVANNPALSTINWGTTNCTNLTIAGNGYSTNGINITMNQLEGVSSVFITNASALSMPALSEVVDLFSVESGGLESVMLPNLTRTGAINVANSAELTNFSSPALQTCGGELRLINNDHLGGTLNFPVLTQIRGDLNITGAFEGVSMPMLNTIQGTSYLWSTQDLSQTCAQFGPGGSYAGSKIRGKVQCHGQQKSASASGGSATNGGSSDSSSQSSGAAIANFVAHPASLFGATGLFAAMLGLM